MPPGGYRLINFVSLCIFFFLSPYGYILFALWAKGLDLGLQKADDPRMSWNRLSCCAFLLLGIFLVKSVRCGPTGTKLGFRSGIFKDFVSEKTRVSLSCRSKDIVVNLNFSDPFRGLVHAGKKDSGCSFRGNGKLSYSLNVPHASCGTIHVTPQDSFANTLTIRYHPALELEGDEIKTILCKYGTGSIQLG